MALYTAIDGVVREIKSLYTAIDGVIREIKEEYCGKDGAVEQIFGKDDSPVIMGMWDWSTKKAYSYVTDNMVVKNSDGSYTLKIPSSGDLQGVLILPQPTDEYNRVSFTITRKSTTDSIGIGTCAASSEPVQDNTSWVGTNAISQGAWSSSTEIDNRLYSGKYTFIYFTTNSSSDTLVVSDLTLYYQ